MKKDLFFPIALLVLCVLLSFGLIHTRGIESDDFCMGQVANSMPLGQGIAFWLENWNSRAFLAFLQLSMYKIPLFADPLQGQWFIYHGLILLMHGSIVVLVYLLLKKYDFSSVASFFGALVFGIHPIIMQPMMWLSAAYGYVLGTFLFVIGLWFFISDREKPCLWKLGLGFLFLLAASLGIEQFVAAVAAMTLVNLVFAPKGRFIRQGLVPLVIGGSIGAITLGFHFLFTAGTVERLGRHAGGSGSLKEFFWYLGWRLNPLPEKSPFGSRFEAGLIFLKENEVFVIVLIALLVFVFLLLSKPQVWSSENGVRRKCLSVGFAGLVLFASTTGIFLLAGSYGMPPRAMYLPLLGLALVGAAVLEEAARKARIVRILVTFGLVAYIFFGSVTNLGAQKFFAESWALHKTVMEKLRHEKGAILDAGCVEVTGISAAPIDEISHLETSWGFPCMTQWLLERENIAGWTNLMTEKHIPECSGDPPLLTIQDAEK